MRTVVLLNRKAGSGKALEKWRRIAPKLSEVVGGGCEVHDETADWRKSLEEASGAGPCLTIAAGGDGTVHTVANIVLSLPARMRARAFLGAVGLGSSNDFHKPASRQGRILGVPVRCLPARTTRQNVLRICYVDPAGARGVRYAVTSASLGMAALGNDLFSRAWGPVGACRSLSTALGVWSASLASLCLQRQMRVRLLVDGRSAYRGEASLVGFYVNRHMAGGLRYPPLMDVGSPSMGVCLVPDVGVFGRTRLLAAAARAGSPSLPLMRLWAGRTCRCVSERPMLLEMDGEVARAREAWIRLVPGALKVCL